MSEKSKPGQIVWQDLTVPNGGEVRDFYSQVVGWSFKGEDMGDYEDYNMLAPSGEKPVAGICHARGTNANVPPAWLLYIAVENLEASLARSAALGGSVLDGPRPMGNLKFAVIRDPAGAMCALIEEPT